MQALAQDWSAADDRRALFAEAYGRMTSAMLSALEDGEFADPTWVSRLLHRFAGYYFDAVEAYDAGDGCPSVWVDAFDGCRTERLHALQVVMQAINAHINHDLVFALADVLDDWPGLDERTRATRQADHLAVNRVIERSVDEVQAEVINRAEPGLALVDRLLGPADEWLFTRMIVRWRAEVWEDCQRLLAATTDAERQAIRNDVTLRALMTGELITHL